MFRTAVLAGLIALSPPAAAQVLGSINRGAPRVTRAVELSDGAALRIEYTAIRFGEGRWREVEREPERQARFNEQAAARPVGVVTVNAPIVAVGNLLPPGTYDLYFTIHPDDGWELNLRPVGEP